MRKVEKTNANFQMLKSECIDFLNSYEDMDDKITDELMLKRAKDFSTLIVLDIFDKAIGRVTNEDDNFLYIEE